MISYKFKNITGTLDVEYLTDAIGAVENFQIYQIKQIVEGKEQIGLNAAAIAFGFSDKQNSSTLENFKKFAEDNSLYLTSYENTANGTVTENIVTPIYDGGGIGELLL